MCSTISYLTYFSKLFIKEPLWAQKMGGGGLQPQSPMGSAAYGNIYTEALLGQYALNVLERTLV